MNIIDLAHQIEDKYRQYLKTSFYFKDPMLRESFEKALKSEYLSKGPYVEATPIFKRGASPKDLFKMLLGYQPDEEFLSAIEIDWLYSHQESSIKKSFEGNNIIVATGTGSGKTESFIYPSYTVSDIRDSSIKRSITFHESLIIS